MTAWLRVFRPAFVTALLFGAVVSAQQPPATARASAPLDLTGQWVALVTDDWRWRMVVPPKVDTLDLPVIDAGRNMASEWDPVGDSAAGEACRGYGAGGIMHPPGRLRIRWYGAHSLTLRTDHG